MLECHIQSGTVAGEADPATSRVASPSARSLQETEVLPAAWEIKPIQAQTEIRLKERITDAIKKTLQQQNRRQSRKTDWNCILKQDYRTSCCASLSKPLQHQKSSFAQIPSLKSIFFVLLLRQSTEPCPKA